MRAISMRPSQSGVKSQALVKQSFLWLRVLPKNTADGSVSWWSMILCSLIISKKQTKKQKKKSNEQKALIHRKRGAFSWHDDSHMQKMSCKDTKSLYRKPNQRPDGEILNNRIHNYALWTPVWEVIECMCEEGN